MRPDLCAVDSAHPPCDYLGRFYVDSLIHDAEMLRQTMRVIGTDRIALGSDYPFPLGEAHPGALIRSLEEVEADACARMLSGSALEFLQVSADGLGR